MKKTILVAAVIVMVIIDIFLIAAVSAVNSFRKEYRNSENAINAILNELQYSKIIAIGETHTVVNEELFLANNIQALYNAGVRYIFIEAGGVSEYKIPSGVAYFILMFYPWMAAGWRYEAIALDQAVIDVNNALPSDDKIKILAVERVPDSITDFAQRWNMRDSNAAEAIIEIMDAASDETKAIILYGAAHTVIYPYKQFSLSGFSGSKFEWLPLGYLLKKHYGSDFSSYEFVSDHDKDFVIRPRYLLDEPKLVALKNMPFANMPLLKDGLARFAWRAGYDGFDGRYDGYIVDPESIYGTFYQYNPTNENLSFIFKIVENYALESGVNISGINYIPFEPENNIILGLNYLKTNLGENFDYASPDTTYFNTEPQGHFMLGLYYLKMYFGDKFDYAFWKTKTSKSLLSALAELRDYAFTNNVPADYIRTNYSRETMLLYHKYMFLSKIIAYNEQQITGNKILENYLIQAREIFPEDLWPLYWLGFVAAEKGEWEKGLAYFQELFADDLAFNMESLPLAYQKAALCAEKSGISQLADEYRRIASDLYNEYNIIVDKNRNSYVGYFNGLRLSY